jgi:hypothetical protein
MDAATLYTIVTLAGGREHIGRDEFVSLAKCEEVRKSLDGRLVGGLPTRYSCEPHVRR